MSDRTREMATVRENSRILDGYYKMTLHAPVIAQRCRPGQFIVPSPRRHCAGNTQRSPPGSTPCVDWGWR